MLSMRSALTVAPRTSTVEACAGVCSRRLSSSNSSSNAVRLVGDASCSGTAQSGKDVHDQLLTIMV